MRKKYTYHRENCNCSIRETVIDIYGRTITLSGQHAFEWSIIISTEDRTVKTVYSKGIDARREFYKLKKKR